MEETSAAKVKLKGRAKDISGQRFGRLVAKYPCGRGHGNKIKWLCVCDCGKEVATIGKDLRLGHTTSCGCSRLGATGKPRHGMTGTSTHNIWATMLARCNDPNRANYHYWGGRGITVCDRWLTFENFLADMGERPEGMTIDRIDNGGNYEPGNCRWATQSQQNFNKRPTRMSKTGVSNVTPTRDGTWRVYFGRTYLGTFKDFFEAACARKSAEAKYSRGERVERAA